MLYMINNIVLSQLKMNSRTAICRCKIETFSRAVALSLPNATLNGDPSHKIIFISTS